MYVSTKILQPDPFEQRYTDTFMVMEIHVHTFLHESFQMVEGSGAYKRYSSVHVDGGPTSFPVGKTHDDYGCLILVASQIFFFFFCSMLLWT